MNRSTFSDGPNMKRVLGAVFLLVLIVGTALILRRSSTYTEQQAEGPIFGTYYHVRYNSPRDLASAILGELERVDASLSLFNPHSILSQINNNTSDKADSLLAEVFTLARTVSVATGGAFDITVAPLVNLYGFGSKGIGNVTPERVDSVRGFVGYEKVALEGDRIRKADGRLMLDCGAIAKGYAVDRVARLLEQEGVGDYMIEIGGEVAVKGKNSQHQPWAVGVLKPEEDSLGLNSELQTVLHMEAGALATSGNYRNFYYKDGKCYAHTIDPRTGQLATHNLLSASVQAADCATADAYATAFMVMGLSSARSLLRQHPELKAILIYDESGTLKTWKSSGLR